MKNISRITALAVLIALGCSSCSNVSAYRADEADSYHTGTFYSGGNKAVTGSSITETRTMNMPGYERIVLQISNPAHKKNELPYYEIEFSDNSKEDFTFTVYSAKLDTTELVGTDDFDLIDDIRIKNDDGNVKIFAECDESLKFKVEENTDSMQLVICIKEINVKEN